MTAIKLLLIGSFLVLLFYGLRTRGSARTSAYTKLAMVVMLLFALYAVLRPGDVSRIAILVGVGRGTDLVLYLLVVAFAYSAISSYLRAKDFELRLAKLARAMALREADSPVAQVASERISTSENTSPDEETH